MIKRVLGRLQKLAVGMVMAGSFVAANVFFDDLWNDGGWFYQHRWFFVLMAVAGLVLIAGYVLAPDTDSE